MNTPLVSIIMPVYNAERYIRQAIDSVLKQDFERWELLIVDDGSSDASLEVARAYSDSRVRVFSQVNGGVARARNFALRRMVGDFFCFLDADDVLPEKSLSLRLNCFRGANVAFADGSVEVFDKDLLVKQELWTPRRPRSLTSSLVRLKGNCFFGPTWMVRRAPQVDFRFDEEVTHGEDLLFYLSYSYLGQYTYSDGVVLQYRKTNNSAMSNLYGLAKGYNTIRGKLKNLPVKISFIDRIIFDAKTRKIVFLSFLKRGDVVVALRYLVLGSL